MKQLELKKLILDFLTQKVGKHCFRLSHFDKSIFLKVEHSTKSSNKKEIDLIYKVYIDNVKKRVFLVGMSENRQHGFFFKKHPVDIRYGNFLKWLSKRDSHDSFEMYFAWNYDFKDQSVYDYIPLDKKIEAEPKPENLVSLVFSSIDDPEKLQMKVKNLHESKISLSYLEKI